MTVIIFKSVLGNATALSREKGFIPSGAVWLQKLQCRLCTFFCILNYLRTYKLLCTPVWIFHIIYFYCVNEYRLQLAFSSLKGLQKFQWSDNTSEYGLQTKCICFDKLLFLNPNQNFIEFIMKSHWWILEVGCNAILMSSPQIHGPYIIGGYRHWIIYKWNY